MSKFTKGILVGGIGVGAIVYAVGSMTSKELFVVLDKDEIFNLNFGIQRAVDNVKEKIQNIVK